MDVTEIFDDYHHTRGELFYKLYKKFSEDEDTLKDVYDNILSNLDEDERSCLLENEEKIACYFTALADQYKKEEEYKKKVLEPAYDSFNKLEAPITIAGFD